MKEKIKYWYGQITCGIPYRVFNRFIHKFGFHYAPKGNIMEMKKCGLTGKKYPTYLYWCHWCGMRDKITDFTRE